MDSDSSFFQMLDRYCEEGHLFMFDSSHVPYDAMPLITMEVDVPNSSGAIDAGTRYSINIGADPVVPNDTASSWTIPLPYLVDDEDITPINKIKVTKDLKQDLDDLVLELDMLPTEYKPVAQQFLKMLVEPTLDPKKI